MCVRRDVAALDLVILGSGTQNTFEMEDELDTLPLVKSYINVFNIQSKRRWRRRAPATNGITLQRTSAAVLLPGLGQLHAAIDMRR